MRSIHVTGKGPIKQRAFVLWLNHINKYVIFLIMAWGIKYYSEKVQQDIMRLPEGLQARYIHLTSRMLVYGPNLREPHTKAMGNGLFELRLKSMEGIARVFYCTVVGSAIVMLHSFIKKTDKTPAREIDTAIKRMKEVKAHAHT